MKYHKILIISIFAAAMFSCNSIEDPEYKKFQNVSVRKSNLKTINIMAEAVFNNPNKMGGKVREIYLDVLDASGDTIGQVHQESTVKIKPKSDFVVPAKISFPTSSLFTSENSILDLVSSALAEKKIKLRFVGYAKVNFAAVPFKVKIDEEDEYDIEF